MTQHFLVKQSFPGVVDVDLTDVLENLLFFSHDAATVGKRTFVKTKKNHRTGWLCMQMFTLNPLHKEDVAVAVGVEQDTVYLPCSEGGCF